MAVKIKILNKVIDESNSEYIAACDLQGLLESSFSDSINGEIYIAYGLTLCGQEVRDIDLFVFGKLENYILKDYYTNDIRYPRKTLNVDEFCCVIELKEHPLSRVRYNGTHILVNYRDDWKDATEQNEKQRYSCALYLKNILGYDVYCPNFLWLKSISDEELMNLVHYSTIGALPFSFNFKNIVDVLISQGLKPYYNQDDRSYHICLNRDKDVINDIKNNLFAKQPIVQGLTRRRLECLNQQYLEANSNNLNIGNNLTIFEGRAGTGKTFRLIELALRYAHNNGDRCLLLTYNHALVGDIRRLLHFMNIPDGIDTYSVQIQTLHSFFMQLMKLFGINTSKLFVTDFNKEYDKCIQELLSYIDKFLNEKDIQFLKEENSLAIDWDYIFIDEAQDWTEKEKLILYKIYGPNRILVADGVDQFMRNNKRLNWKEGDANIIKQTKGLRQKNNLVNFVNLLATKLNVNWNVKPNYESRLCGGQIIITDHYTKDLHDKLVEQCKTAKCENYDILFLIPYQMKPTYNHEEDGIIKIDLEKWKTSGIHLFDGTNENKKRQYSTDVNECRLYLYESCRGLESWVTVCLNFDVLLENKFVEYKNEDFSNNLALESEEDIRKRLVYLWGLMPLTRPIDTLVITLKNSNSEIGQVLKELSLKHQDYIIWACK